VAVLVAHLISKIQLKHAEAAKGVASVECLKSRETLINAFPCAEFALQSSKNRCKFVRIHQRF
jgi:hypothetical protein